MAKKKKKKVLDENATFKNGMNVQRVKNSCKDGGIIFVYLCLLGLFAYFVMMIPGLSGILIAKEAEVRNQTIYHIMSTIQVVLGVLVGTIGIMQFTKGSGESDAMFVLKRNMDRKYDVRYTAIMVAIGIGAFFIMGTLLNIDFFVGPVKYLSILLGNYPRVMPGDDPVKIALGYRVIAMTIYMACVAPFAFIGVKKGYTYKLEMEEAEEERMSAHREEMEKNAEESAQN